MSGATAFLKELSYFVFGCTCILLLGGGGAMAATPPAANVISSHNLAGHKAVYEIKLSSSKMGSAVIGIHGRMTYIVKPSCEGWIVDHQFRLIYDYTNNPSSEVDTKFASFENYNGQQFQFSSTRRSNGEINSELRGDANLPSVEGTKNMGTARYSIPTNLTYHLSTGTLFPIMHTAYLVAAAEAGQKVFNAHVFDGSDEDGPVEINAFIGPVHKAQKWDAPKNIDQNLTAVDEWPVRMAVFSDKEEQSEAEYELTMTLLKNGIIKDMAVEYHDFSITQKLVALEKITAEKCGE
ncbi:MAG: DUF1849 family protein [Pseudomonadota bacterium]